MGELNTFPVSYKVKGQRIVIVGGGEDALNKARLAAKTTASVVIVADATTVSFAGIDHALVSRSGGFGALDGAALLFVAEKSAFADAVTAAARRRGIPVNVVDTPDDCDFYVPAIVERAPLTVAVSTEGDAPVLARLVRARIEAMLAPDLGRLARLAGALRGRVAAQLGKLQARRFYEDLVTGVGEPEGLFRAHAGAPAGEVWLIGAGPGAEDLLTLRAQRLLQAADVIVHDRAVPEAVIEMGRRDAERVVAGGTRAEMEALLLRLARQGRRVARLVHGDAVAPGRGGEEVALRRAGIVVRVVPGVSPAAARVVGETAPAATQFEVA